MGKSCHYAGMSVLILLGFLLYSFRTLGDVAQVVRYRSDCRRVGVSGGALDRPCFAEDDWGTLSSRPARNHMHYDLTFRLRSGQEVSEPVPYGLDGAMMPASRLYTLTLWRGRVTQFRDPAGPVDLRDSPVTALHWDGRWR